MVNEPMENARSQEARLSDRGLVEALVIWLLQDDCGGLSRFITESSTHGSRFLGLLSPCVVVIMLSFFCLQESVDACSIGSRISYLIGENH